MLGSGLGPRNAAVNKTRREQELLWVCHVPGPTLLQWYPSRGDLKHKSMSMANAGEKRKTGEVEVRTRPGSSCSRKLTPDSHEGRKA